MKQVIQENEANIIDEMLGKKVLIHCAMYHYAGEVVAIDSDFLKLKNPKIVLNSSVDEDEHTTAKKFKTSSIIIAKSFIEMVTEDDRD